MTIEEIIEAFEGKPDRHLLHKILETNFIIINQNRKIMGFADDLGAQLDRIEKAQTDAATQNGIVASEIKTLISEIGTTPGISADDAAKLIARATTIADASEALDTALQGSASAGANTPAPTPPVDTPPAS